MLFTVSATFSDFTAAYEQYEAEGPTEALAAFVLNAESLGAYDPGSRDIAAQAEGHRLIRRSRGRWKARFVGLASHEPNGTRRGCTLWRLHCSN